MAKTDEDPRRFLDPRVIGRISSLDLRAKQAVAGFISGMHKSPFFGQSVAFVQHREYVPGDDIRHIDWKVWSRTDKFYLKQFEAETNLRCTLVVDTSESMVYGNGAMNKYEYACTAAACLAHLTAKQQDSVGLVTYGVNVNQILPARSAMHHVDAITKSLDLSRPKAKTDVFKAMRQIAEHTPSRGLVVLFSDLLADREPIFRGLELLRHRRHDVMVFHVMDDDELTFPFGGMTRFEGMEEQPNMMCDPKALREGYLEVLEEYLTEVRRGCSRMGVDYSLVRTSDYLDAILSRFLNQRMASRGTPARL